MTVRDVVRPERWARLGAVWSRTCVLRAGSAYCWGRNTVGQLGDGDAPNSTGVPVQVAGDDVFTTLSAGEFNTCGIETEGVGWCWGAGSVGNTWRNVLSGLSLLAAGTGVTWYPRRRRVRFVA